MSLSMSNTKGAITGSLVTLPEHLSSSF